MKVNKTKVAFYRGSYPFRHYLISVLTEDAIRCSEAEFFRVVGYNRTVVPMHYDKDNVNRQNFYLNGELIAYRER